MYIYIYIYTVSIHLWFLILFALCSDSPENKVTIDTVNEAVGALLDLMAGHFAVGKIDWFPRLLDSVIRLAGKCSIELLDTQLIEIMDTLSDNLVVLWRGEQYATAAWNHVTEEDGSPDPLHSVIEVLAKHTRI